MAVFLSASETNTKCQPWRLEPVGAWTAIWRHSSSSSRGTGRDRSSRLRTALVVVRTSSGLSRGSVVTCLQLVPQRVVALELVQRQPALGALGVLGGLDRLQQQLDLLGREPILMLVEVGLPAPPLDQVADRLVGLVDHAGAG